MPHNDPWTPAEVALLGTMTDAALARRLGRTTWAVQHHRRLLGIPAYTPARVEMTPEHRALLGQIADAKLAEMVGCHRRTIRATRERHGIPAAHPERRPKT